MERQILGVVWDLDGVLIESELYHADVDIAALKPYDIPLTSEVWFENMGMRMEDFFLFMARKYGVDLPLEQVVQQHNLILEQHYLNVFPAVEHAATTLAELSVQYPQGLNTSRGRNLAEAALQRHGMLDYLGERVYGEDIEIGKPDPSSYLLLAQRMKLNPNQIVVVEDTKRGFQSARSAGMMVIARKGQHNLKEDYSLANFMIEDLREIPTLIRKFK